MVCVKSAHPAIFSLNFLVWKSCGKAQFPQKFYIRKLGEIMVFYAVF